MTARLATAPRPRGAQAGALWSGRARAGQDASWVARVVQRMVKNRNAGFPRSCGRAARHGIMRGGAAGRTGRPALQREGRTSMSELRRGPGNRRLLGAVAAGAALFAAGTHAAEEAAQAEPSGPPAE